LPAASCASRIDDAKPKLIVTADAGLRVDLRAVTHFGKRRERLDAGRVREKSELTVVGPALKTLVALPALRRASDDDAVADAAFQFQMKAQGVVYTPTFAVNENYARVLGLSFRPTALETRLGDPIQIRSLLSLAELYAAELRRREAEQQRGIPPTVAPAPLR